ncbi:AAA family ATPase [Kolteria novifilia]|uniref:AAA family ATPase n=1 Tax=Kolteria novifilia TaxID=2527975 RepID=UPI003AF3FE8E
MTDAIARLRGNIESVFLGKPDVVDGVLVALLARGHVLIEDVPGVGKTLVTRALAKSLDCAFRRVQFTPDLLPSDIIGSTVFDSKSSQFVFNEGPLFAHIVLADEINRTSPRTQSALLEAMNEGHVSIDGKTHRLPQPFLVLATQNPFEFEGTYPLPESQLDRFLVRLSIGYPSREEEEKLLLSHRRGEPVDELSPVMGMDELRDVQAAVSEVTVDESVTHYLLDIVHATREHSSLRIGVSTRGALALYRSCQAAALLRGRAYAVPDDVKELAVRVLAHRVMTRSPMSLHDAEASSEVIQSIVDHARPPE